MDSVRKSVAADISALHANIMKDKIDLDTVSEINTADDNLELNMRNKSKSEVDTYSLIKATTDDNIAVTSNLKYEQEVKLSSASEPASINHPLLVGEMEVPNGRMARDSESDIFLSKDGEHSIKDVRVDDGMPSEDKLLIYSDHNTCVEKVSTVMNYACSGSLENRECKLESQSSSALDVNRLTKDAVTCCQLNNNSGKEAFIFGSSNLDDMNVPDSLEVNKEAKQNGISHPYDECSDCALSQKNVDMYSTNMFQSQTIHQAEPECSSAPSESHSALSTCSVTYHAVSVHVSEVTGSLNNDGMPLKAPDNILIGPCFGQKFPSEQTAESEVDGKKSVAESDSDKTGNSADLSTSEKSVRSSIYTSTAVDGGAIKDVENHRHKTFGNPGFAGDIAGQTCSLEMEWNVTTQSSNEVISVTPDKVTGNNSVAEMVNHVYSAPIPLSGRISYSGPISCSGSISLRSDSSTASTRSFAFPILSNEYNSSPVKMPQADSRYYKKKQRWRCCFFCCCP